MTNTETVKTESLQSVRNNDILKASILFSLSSICMILLNKGVMTVFPNAGFLLVLQNICTLVILRMNTDIIFNNNIAYQWLPCSMLFCCNIFSSLEALLYINVPTFTVLRNTQPIITSIIDYIVRHEHISWTSLFLLIVVFVGAFIFGCEDVLFDWRGYFWATLHIISMSCYAVSVKLYGSKLNLQATEMSLYNNVNSIPILTLLALFPPGHSGNSITKLSHDMSGCTIQCVLLVVASCIGGYFISTTGFRAQQVLGATSWITLNNISKIPAIVISYVIFGGVLTPIGAFGMSITLLAAYMYSLSRQSDCDYNICFWYTPVHTTEHFTISDTTEETEEKV
jgi:drug/metabolite transporter (DMT)-like permease